MLVQNRPSADKMQKDLFRRLRALIYIRVIVVTVLLGTLYIFRIEYSKLLSPVLFSYFIAFLYLLTIIYAVVLTRISKSSHLKTFAYAQIVIDVAAEAFLIYMTGGVESMFPFLFPLSILSAGIVLNRRACYVIATLSSILYGGLLDLQYYNIIRTSTELQFTEKDFFYKVFAHILAFYMIGYLGGYLSERLHKATLYIEERDTVLSDLKAFSEYIIESMPSGIFTTDLNNRIITFNTSAQEITNLQHDYVLGRKPDEIFPFLGSVQEPLERIEGEIQRGDEAFPVGMRLSKLKDSSGRAIGLIGVFQDLTELKAMEAEVKRKERWAFIGELSASIAHELRNPLASLRGSIEMLKEKKVNADHADRLMEIALSEMNRLNSIITDFLLYAKPQELNRKTFDLNQSLKNIVALLQNSDKAKKDVTISAQLQGSLTLSGDAKQMQQVFWNLGTNAVDAVGDGGKVDISTRKRNNRVEIAFSDNGTGISRDDMERIFYPFFTTKEGGTGLGLAIARKITEEHGGRILVESGGSGMGASFRVILPVSD